MAKRRSPRRSAITSDARTSVAALRKLMADFVAEREWGAYHTPRNLAASVSIEAAELLEHYQWLTAEEAAHKSRHDPAFRHAVGEELADVLLYLLSLANALEIDLTDTVHAKMERNRRKYPVAQFRGRYERPVRTSAFPASMPSRTPRRPRSKPS